MDIKAKNGTSCHEHGGECAEVPELKRLRYFYGQMLGVHDFQSDQSYFREKLKLHNRCLHGYGTVCGLMVVPEPRGDDCVPQSDADRARAQAALDAKLAEMERAKKEISALEKQKMTGAGENGPTTDLERKTEEAIKNLKKLEGETEGLRRELEALPPGDPRRKDEPTAVRIECGLALDCEGNEIIVRRPLRVDLWQTLSAEDRNRVAGGAETLYVSLCYCEQPVDPVRPVLQDACGAAMECTYGKLRDAVKVRVSLDPPLADNRCEPCCEPCREPCLVLARIDGFKKASPLTADAIDNSVRRLVGPYTATTITGISWTHGAEYTDREAASILGSDIDDAGSTKGIKVTFSRPVLTSTLTKGVVDIWIIQAGKGRSGDIYQLDGEFVDLDPNQRTTSELRFRDVGDEDLDPEDRVLITVRSAFILDECCQPVSGAHVGGRVPFVKDEELKRFDRTPKFAECALRPPGYAPWTSGFAPGVNFESWFFVKRTEKEKKS